MPMQTFILCADDYGLNPAVNAGIIALLTKQRLSAVSCLTNFSHWTSSSKNLLPYRFDVALGVHLNLTEGTPLTSLPKLAPTEKFPSLPRLMFLSANKLISEAEIVQEWRAQILAFHNQLGIWPAFLDGHQHVQQFPIIRNALRYLWHEFLVPNQPNAYLRAAYLPPWQHLRTCLYLKAWVIYLFGGAQLKRILMLEKIPHNRSFSGIYSFSARGNYRKNFQQFLNEIESDGIIMCHPGEADLEDILAPSRVEELDYFLSDAFIRDCQQAGKWYCFNRIA
jgi:predicted glycoside hydrolase/deacetylase ChbG (UPF0249 family)